MKGEGDCCVNTPVIIVQLGDLQRIILLSAHEKTYIINNI